jgi:hypothetical protein
MWLFNMEKKISRIMLEMKGRKQI